MTTDLGKTRARDIGSGKVPESAVSVTATAVASAALTASNPAAPAALTAANPAAPTAFTAPVTGSAITVSTNDAADLTTIGDALKVLRDEVALYELQISALIADADAARTEQISYEVAISALIVDIAAQKAEQDKLVTDMASIRTELVAMNLVAA